MVQPSSQLSDQNKAFPAVAHHDRDGGSKKNSPPRPIGELETGPSALRSILANYSQRIRRPMPFKCRLGIPRPPSLKWVFRWPSPPKEQASRPLRCASEWHRGWIVPGSSDRTCWVASLSKLRGGSQPCQPMAASLSCDSFFNPFTRFWVKLGMSILFFEFVNYGN
jgi:hypothetical protein